MTFFVVDGADMSLDVNAMIAENGGRANVEVVPMWALFGPLDYAKGTWSFFAPCTTPTGLYTTSMVLPPNGNKTAAACNQHEVSTRKMTRSGKYQGFSTLDKHGVC